MVAEPLNLILASFLSCLIVADGVLTYEILRRGGRELNPVLRWLFEKIGVIEGIVLSRLILIMIFIVAIPNSPVWLFVLFNIFYAFVIAHNAQQLMGDK